MLSGSGFSVDEEKEFPYYSSRTRIGGNRGHSTQAESGINGHRVAVRLFQQFNQGIQSELLNLYQKVRQNRLCILQSPKIQPQTSKTAPSWFLFLAIQSGDSISGLRFIGYSSLLHFSNPPKWIFDPRNSSHFAMTFFLSRDTPFARIISTNQICHPSACCIIGAIRAVIVTQHRN